MEKQRNFTSSLKFNGYFIDEVTFTRNKKLPPDIDSWKMDFDISSIIKTTKEKNKMSINLVVEIFKSTKNPPFTMKVDMLGEFELVGEDNIERYKANAIAIMYPYVRAIVSTYTSSSNVLPVILPAINVNAMLNEK